MCTSTTAATALSLLTDRRKLVIEPPIVFLRRRSCRNVGVRLAVAEKRVENSWFFPDESGADDDDYGGWALKEVRIPKKNSGLPKFLVAGMGTSVALLVAAVAYFPLSKKGIRFPFSHPSSVSCDASISSTPESPLGEYTDSGASNEDNVVSEISKVDPADAARVPVQSEKCQPRIIHIAVDTAQQEAFATLKKLKIIEDDAKADELCTRREYARWLVHASSLLERNPKYKIAPPIALSGSIVAAYEDVGTDDTDFEPIQALAEAGVTSSNLFGNYSLGGHGGINFSPDRYVSRLDLIDWRAQLEYNFPTAGNGEIPKTKLDLIDMREISTEAAPGVFMDFLAGDKSLLRRVFGKIRRLQPYKPSTKAQAAVALTSGRMAEAIHAELQRLEAEESSRQAAKEEIKREFLGRGDIQRFWHEKMEEEKTYGLQVNQLYLEALQELKQEKIVHEVAFSEVLKERAAIDCQRQLLNCLKEEVDEMSERLTSEKAELIAEEESVKVVHSDLQMKQEGILEAKSLLEAEIEALRILRSWIEDEARKSEARAKVLEEVGQRWKWDRQA